METYVFKREAKIDKQVVAEVYFDHNTELKDLLKGDKFLDNIAHKKKAEDKGSSYYSIETKTLENNEKWLYVSQLIRNQAYTITTFEPICKNQL